jgi:hypothetical protein
MLGQLGLVSLFWQYKVKVKRGTASFGVKKEQKLLKPFPRSS